MMLFEFPDRAYFNYFFLLMLTNIYKFQFSFFIMFYKKCLSGVVAISLLMLASTVFYFVAFDSFQDVKSNFEVLIASKNLEENFEINKIEGTKMYVQNDFKNDLILNSLSIGDRVCYLNNYSIDIGSAVVDIGGCTYGLEEIKPYDIKLVTDYGVYDNYEVLKDPLDNSLIVSYQFEECSFAMGEVRLFGLTDIDNAHVDIDGSSTYNLCVRHLDYDLSLGVSANSQDIIYLIGENNSAVWTRKDLVLVEPSSWVDVVLSSSDGVFNYQINSTQPDFDYVCLGSIDRDDVYGSHMGDCDSTLPDKIWIRLQ